MCTTAPLQRNKSRERCQRKLSHIKELKIIFNSLHTSIFFRKPPVIFLVPRYYGADGTFIAQEDSVQYLVNQTCQSSKDFHCAWGRLVPYRHG